MSDVVAAPAPDDEPDLPLARIPTPAEQAARLFGAAQEAVFMSFDPRTPDGGRLLDKCEESPDHKLIEKANLTFQIQHIYAHYITVVNKETAEARDALRVCLISDKGEVFSCVSEGVRKAVRRLMLKRGLPPYNPPEPVQVQLKRIGENRQWLTFLTVAESDSSSAPPPTDRPTAGGKGSRPK